MSSLSPLLMELSAEERNVFVAEAEEMVDQAEQILLEMEEAGSSFGRRREDAGKLDAFFREMHTLKGNAGSVGLDGMAGLAHAVEDVMQSLRDGRLEVDGDLSEALLNSIDCLRAMVAEFAAAEEVRQAPRELIERLEAFRGSDRSVSAGSPTDGAERDLLRELGAVGPGEGRILAVRARVSPEGDMPVVRALQFLMACEKVCTRMASTPSRENVEAGYFNDERLVCYLISTVEENTLVEELEQISGVTVDGIEALEACAMGPEDGEEGQAEGDAPGVKKQRRIRVDVAVLDRLMNLMGEMVINRNRLSSLVREMNGQDANGLKGMMQETVEHLSRATMDLQEDVMQMRLLPLDELFRRYPRMMRNLRRASGKAFDFVIEGGETEIDRSLMEVIADPLTHILRNAVDHGIETRETRIIEGKEPEGKITLSASRNENYIVVEVSDDGAGINEEALRRRAGAGDAEVADEDLVDLIFASGFSMAEEVTEISGRGVGLDVVRRSVEAVNGKISVDNRPGQGVIFRLSLPLTVTTVKSLLVSIAGQAYVLPLTSVRETLNRADVESGRAGNTPVLNFRDQFIPLYHLGDFFPEVTGDHREASYVVVLHTDQRDLGLLVDDLLGEEDCVIKPLNRPIDDIRGVSAATILPDGRVALILDSSGLMAQKRPTGRVKKLEA